MNKRIFSFFIFFSFFLILITSTVISAEENSSVDVFEEENIHTELISKKDVMKNYKEQNNENNVYKEQSSENKVIHLNTSNFNTYVTDGKFNENVSDGDTVDIQDKLDGSKFALEINKPINLVSSNNDPYINFHTSSTDTHGGYTGGIFKISAGGSGSNITGLNFYNTRVSIENTSNININNIKCFDERASIGMGVGAFTVREGSENITITNSYFKTQTNGGHSNVVFAAAYNCLFENNTIEGYGRDDEGTSLIGNLLYLTTYEVQYATPITNINITIRNNIIRSYYTYGYGTCYGLAIEGTGHIIENNLIDTGIAFKNQYGDSDYDFETNVDGIIFNNNTLTCSDYNTVSDGYAELQFPGICSNNTFNVATTIKQAYVYNNEFKKTVTITNNTRFENNTAKKILITSENNTLINNIVSTNETYAIIITGENNTLISNKLLSNNGYGENAISNSSEYNSEDNNEEIYPIIYINDDNIDEYITFDEINTQYAYLNENIRSNVTLVINSTRLDGYIVQDYSGASSTKTVETFLNICNSTGSFSLRLSPKYITINNSKLGGFVGLWNKNPVLTIENSIIPKYVLSGRRQTLTLNNINSTFLNDFPVDNTYILSNNLYFTEKSPFISEQIFNSTGNIIESIPSSFNILLLTYDYLDSTQQQYVTFHEDLYIDKIVNITVLDESIGRISANLHFLEGSEGSTVNGVTFNGNVILDTDLINFFNCTFNKELYINQSNLKFEENIFNDNITLNSTNNIIFNNNTINTDEAINIISSRNCLFENNTINSTSQNTIVFDDESYYNKISKNTLISSLYTGDESVLSGDNEVNNNLPLHDTEIIINCDTPEFVEDVSEINIVVNDMELGTPVEKGLVEIYMDGYFVNKTDLVNGEINITIPKKDGNYQLRIWYYDGVKYNNNETSVNLEIIKSNVTISVGEFTAKLNEKTNTEITFLNQKENPVVDNNITVTVGSTSYILETVDGVATLDEIVTTEWLDTGKMIITFPETDMYNRNTTTITLNTSKADTLITSEISIEENTVSITLTLTDDLGQNVTDGRIIITTIDGTELANGRVSNGLYTVNVSLPDDYADEYIIANFTGSYYYNNQVIELSTVTVKEETIISKIEVIPDPFIIGSQAIFNVTITSENESVINEGLIIVTDNEDNIIANATVTDNNAQLEFVSDNVGENTYTIIYSDATHFNDTTATITITTRKIQTNFEVEYTISDDGEDIEFIIKSFDEFGNPTDEQINATINGKRVARGLPDNGILEGYYTIPSDTDMVTITVNYAGNTTHEQTSKEFPMVINKQDTILTLNPVEAMINEEVTITATITDTNNNTINEGVVTFILDDGTVIGTSNVTDSTATITQTFTEALNTKITVTYSQSQAYNDNNATTTIIIKEPVEKVLKVDTTTFTIGQSTQIKASIYEDDQVVTNITKGKVVFKVNGKTLKDDNGKVIYAKIVNGTATIENYTIPSTWNKDNLTIEAVYSGSNQQGSLRSEEQVITIEEAKPTITTEDITANIGDTVTLKATVNAGDKQLNTGKVVFKINGKTVKDANGKVLYAQVNDGLAVVNYAIPSNLKVKSYEIVAVFISSDYGRLEDSKTLTLTEA